MTHDNAAWDFMCDQVIALKTALAAEKADHTETQRDQQRVFAEYRAEKAALTAAEKERDNYRVALERISTGRALDPHNTHDPVALAECKVAYCIARAALIDWRRTKEGA